MMTKMSSSWDPTSQPILLKLIESQLLRDVLHSDRPISEMTEVPSMIETYLAFPIIPDEMHHLRSNSVNIDRLRMGSVYKKQIPCSS